MRPRMEGLRNPQCCDSWVRKPPVLLFGSEPCDACSLAVALLPVLNGQLLTRTLLYSTFACALVAFVIGSVSSVHLEYVQDTRECSLWLSHVCCSSSLDVMPLTASPASPDSGFQARLAHRVPRAPRCAADLVHLGSRFVHSVTRLVYLDVSWRSPHTAYGKW